MRLRIDDNLLITFIYILSGAMLVGQFFGAHGITSIAFAVSFIIVLAIWLLHLRDCRVLDVLAIAIAVISLLCAIVTCTNLSVSYFYGWLMFSMVFLYFAVCLKIRLNYQTVSKLFKINFFLIVCCCFAYVVRFDTAFYITNTGVKYLTFDFYNPNCLALFLICLAVTGMQYYLFYCGRFSLVKQVCYIGVFLILIMQTLSRTTLIAFCFFIIIYMLFRRKGYYYLPQSGLFNMLVASFPLMFSILYMMLLEFVLKNNIFSFLVSEGKQLDARQKVWRYAFDLFKESPLWGSYGNIMNSSTFSQMHNSHVNVMVSYGVIVLLLVILFLFIVLTEVGKKNRGKVASISVWAFIICLLLGSGEAILFSGGLSFYLMVGQFLLFSNASIEQKET